MSCSFMASGPYMWVYRTIEEQRTVVHVCSNLPKYRDQPQYVQKAWAGYPAHDALFVYDREG